VGASVYYGAPPGSTEQLSSWLASASLTMPSASCGNGTDGGGGGGLSLPSGGGGGGVLSSVPTAADWDEATVDERRQMLSEWEFSCGRPAMRWADVGPAYTASLYWTFTTITTVGYGDLTPKATGERAFAIFAMCIGTGLFGYIISAMTNTLSDSFKGDAVVRRENRSSSRKASSPQSLLPQSLLPQSLLHASLLCCCGWQLSPMGPTCLSRPLALSATCSMRHPPYPPMGHFPNGSPPYGSPPYGSTPLCLPAPLSRCSPSLRRCSTS
jgi:hypothetical protein